MISLLIFKQQKFLISSIIFNFSASRSDVKKNLESWIAQTLTTNDQASKLFKLKIWKLQSVYLFV